MCHDLVTCLAKPLHRPNGTQGCFSPSRLPPFSPPAVPSVIIVSRAVPRIQGPQVRARLSHQPQPVQGQGAAGQCPRPLPGLPRDCSGRCCSILGVAPRSSQQQGRLKMETRDSSHLHSRGRHGGMHGGGGGAFVARRENKVKTEMQLRSQAACFELSD